MEREFSTNVKGKILKRIKRAVSTLLMSSMLLNPMVAYAGTDGLPEQSVNDEILAMDNMFQLVYHSGDADAWVFIPTLSDNADLTGITVSDGNAEFKKQFKEAYQQYRDDDTTVSQGDLLTMTAEHFEWDAYTSVINSINQRDASGEQYVYILDSEMETLNQNKQSYIPKIRAYKEKQSLIGYNIVSTNTYYIRGIRFYFVDVEPVFTLPETYYGSVSDIYVGQQLKPGSLIFRDSLDEDPEYNGYEDEITHTSAFIYTYEGVEKTIERVPGDYYEGYEAGSLAGEADGYAEGYANGEYYIYDCDYDTLYNNGYNSGYEYGYSQGKILKDNYGQWLDNTETFDLTYDIGYKIGQNKANDNNEETLAEYGTYDDGYNKEYNKSYNKALMDTIDNYYDYGYEEGYNDAYDSSYDKGYNDALLAADERYTDNFYWIGYSDGEDVGYVEGYNSIHNSTYTLEDLNSFFLGYDTGWNDAYEPDYWDGSEDGYEDGKYDGFIHNYENGKTVITYDYLNRVNLSATSRSDYGGYYYSNSTITKLSDNYHGVPVLYWEVKSINTVKDWSGGTFNFKSSIDYGNTLVQNASNELYRRNDPITGDYIEPHYGDGWTDVKMIEVEPVYEKPVVENPVIGTEDFFLTLTPTSINLEGYTIDFSDKISNKTEYVYITRDMNMTIEQVETGFKAGTIIFKDWNTISNKVLHEGDYRVFHYSDADVTYNENLSTTINSGIKYTDVHVEKPILDPVEITKTGNYDTGFMAEYTSKDIYTETNTVDYTKYINMLDLKLEHLTVTDKEYDDTRFILDATKGSFTDKDSLILGYNKAFARQSIVIPESIINESARTYYSEISEKIWDLEPKYYIRYIGTGGAIGSMDDTTAYFDTETTLSKNSYTNGAKLTLVYNDGTTADNIIDKPFTFLGWDDEAISKEVYLKDESKVKNLATKNEEIVNVYTVWEPQYEKLLEPVREGWKFVGWKDTDGTVYNAGDNYYVDEDSTLTALWEENESSGSVIPDTPEITPTDKPTDTPKDENDKPDNITTEEPSKTNNNIKQEDNENDYVVDSKLLNNVNTGDTSLIWVYVTILVIGITLVTSSINFKNKMKDSIEFEENE